jgi:hypothetical protein
MSGATPKPLLRIDFTDFGAELNKTDNFFTQLLARRFRIEICDRPELLIYADKGHTHRLYTCRKLFWTGESVRADFRQCDYALTTFYENNPRHERLPYYVAWLAGDPSSLMRDPGQGPRLARSREKFCGFAQNNGNPRRTRRRLEMRRLLNEYRPVDGCGRVCNTIGGPIAPGKASKLAFLRNYRFNLCFENRAFPGYTTEKLTDAYEAGCVPLYWGNPLVERDFNPRAFVNLHDFSDDAAFVAKVAELDHNEDARSALLSEPLMTGNQPNEFFRLERYLDFFERILADRSTPVSRRTFRIFGRWTLVRRHP